MTEAKDTPQAPVIFHGTVQLLGWSDTHNGGAKLVLQLEDSDALEPFKTLTVKHGKMAGQLLAIAVALEEPEGPRLSKEELRNPLEEKPKGGPLSNLAGIWCGNPDFHAWLQEYWPDEWSAALELIEQPSDGETAKQVVYYICGVNSLALLDHSPAAADLFQRCIRAPYMAKPV